MDKGWGPPQPYPSRLANGQELGALQPFTTWKRPPNGQGLGPTSKWTRVGGPDKICKWTRVGLHDSPPTLQDLQMDKLHDLQMDKGWGAPQPFTTPTLHDLLMDKGLAPPPHPSRLANGPPQPFTTYNGQGFKPPFTTCKWTRV